MRILGFIFLALMVSASILYFSYNIGGSFLDDFIKNDFINTYATLVGLNLAAVTFLVSQLISIEDKHGKELFSETKVEIKHNSYYLLFSLPAAIIILSLRPNLKILPNLLQNNTMYYVSNLLVIFLFTLTIFSIFEILTAIFKINKGSKFIKN